MILQVLIAMVAGWINRHQQHVITYLKEENLRFPLGRIKARCLVGTFPQSPRLAPCVRFSPHTAQHLWSFSMDIHEASVLISPAPQCIPRRQLARSLGPFGPIFPKAKL